MSSVLAEDTMRVSLERLGQAHELGTRLTETLAYLM